MSTVYHPDPTVDSPRGQTRKAIVSTTFATPIKVEVTGHGYGDGDSVEVVDPQDAAAKGLWNVTIVDANHFTLNGSVGAMAGGAQGYVHNWTVLPNATIPADGDLVDATNANTPVEAALNLAPFIYRLSGSERIYHVESSGTSDETWSAWSSNPNSGHPFDDSNWRTISGGGSIFSPSPIIYGNTGDVVEVHAEMTASSTGGSGLAAVALGVEVGGVRYTVAGSAQRLWPTTDWQRVVLRARYTLTGPGALDVAILGYGNAGSPQSVDFKGHRSLLMRVNKAN